MGWAMVGTPAPHGGTHASFPVARFRRAQAFQEFVRNYRAGGGGDGRRGRAGSLLQ